MERRSLSAVSVYDFKDEQELWPKKKKNVVCTNIPYLLFLLVSYDYFYYMISDNVFSDWLTSLVTFFDKMLYSHRVTSREVNITFQRLAPS
jgi:hypothetical protein